MSIHEGAKSTDIRQNLTPPDVAVRQPQTRLPEANGVGMPPFTAALLLPATPPLSEPKSKKRTLLPSGFMTCGRDVLMICDFFDL